MNCDERREASERWGKVQIPRPAGSAEQRQASLWRQAPRKARLLQTLAGQGQEALSFTWRAIDRSQDAGGQRPRPGRVNRRTPSVDRTNEGRREEVSVGSKGRLSMDYARNARTGNASIAGTRRLARSADKVAAPHDAARRATASRDRSARRVARTVQESLEVDLPSSRDRSHRGRRRNPGHIPGRDRQHDAGQRVRRCRRADRPC